MAADIEDSRSARFALRCSSFAERRFPDSWVFAALAVIIVALATMAMGANPPTRPWRSATVSGA